VDCYHEKLTISDDVTDVLSYLKKKVPANQDLSGEFYNNYS
jgi:hypothetical protein